MEGGRKRKKYRQCKKGWQEGYLEEKIRMMPREQEANKKLRKINDVPPSLDEFFLHSWTIWSLSANW